MLDTKLNHSGVKSRIQHLVEKTLYPHISANQVTIFALVAGIIAASLIGIIGALNLPSDFQEKYWVLWKFATKTQWLLMFQTIGDGSFWTDIHWKLGDTLYFIAILLIIISFTADIVDGTIARLDHPTKFGGMLDIISDRIVELSLIIAIVGRDSNALVWPGLCSVSAIVLCSGMFLLVGGMITSPEQNNLSSQKKVIFYSSALMERTETFLFLLIMVLFEPLQVIMLWIFAVLVFLSFLQRFLNAYHMFYHQE